MAKTIEELAQPTINYVLKCCNGRLDWLEHHLESWESSLKDRRVGGKMYKTNLLIIAALEEEIKRVKEVK